MDGVLNNAIFTDIWAVSPPPDALQEFNVQSHMTDAQFAISSGANINIVTRSGTNQFHGSAWEFFRNDVLDARNFFDQTKPPYRQNQYGVTFGGPVRLPFFNGKDNTWFEGYWEGFRSVQSLSYFSSVPTAAMRGGDFSGILGAPIGTDSLGRPIFQNEIYDPNTTRPDPANPLNVIRDPFAGNRIPTNRLNPVDDSFCRNIIHFQISMSDKMFFQIINSLAEIILRVIKPGIRIDHRFGDNDTLFGRYNRSDANFYGRRDYPHISSHC